METNESSVERVMTPLDPNLLWVLRIRAAAAAAVFVIAAWGLDAGPLRELGLRPGLVPAAAAALALLGVAWLPARRYRAWGYHEGEDELHVRYGLFTRVHTAVPFGRVQHIDVAHGPVERRFGLATLILHTAGTRGAAVPLPGLRHDEAERMRDRIRAKIRQDLA